VKACSFEDGSLRGIKFANGVKSMTKPYLNNIYWSISHGAVRGTNGRCYTDSLDTSAKITAAEVYWNATQVVGVYLENNKNEIRRYGYIDYAQFVQRITISNDKQFVGVSSRDSMYNSMYSLNF